MSNTAGNTSNNAMRNGMLKLLQEEVLELRRVNERLQKENERLQERITNQQYAAGREG